MSKKFIAVAIIMTAALLLRLWDINARSLWFDEAYEYWSSIAPLQSLHETVLTSSQPPLYTYILHGWLKIGDGPVFLRMLSVLFSLFSVLGMIFLGYESAGQKGGVTAGILMAVLPPEIRYAQEVAEYALTECLIIWSLYFLLISFKAPSWGKTILWGSLGLLAVFSHYGAMIVIFSVSIAAIFENMLRKRWDVLKMQLLTGLAAVAFSVPVLLLFFFQQFSAQNLRIAELTSLTNEVILLVRSIGDSFLFALAGWPYTSIGHRYLLTITYAILMLSVVVFFFKSDQRSRRIVAWFWVSLSLYYILVRFGFYARGQFGFRYANILIPLFVLIIASIVQWLTDLKRSVDNRIWKYVLVFAGWLPVIIILAIALYSLPNRTISERNRGSTPWPETQDMGEIVGYWNEHKEEGQVTYVYYGALPAFRYYLRLYGFEQNDPLPATWWTSLCWKNLESSYCNSTSIYYGEWARGFTAEEHSKSIEKTFGEMPDTFWIIFSHINLTEDQDILTMLSEKYEVIQKEQRANASIVLLKVK